MTEAEWLACDDPHTCVTQLPPNASEKRLRRLAIVWCQACWEFLPARSRIAIATAEKCFDGFVSDAERAQASEEAETEYYDLALRRARETLDGKPSQQERAAHAAHAASAWEHKPVHFALGSALALACSCWNNCECVALLREVLGNPFRSVAFAPSWRTGTVVALASQMYESREFRAVPILGDALQDAGCDAADVLNHCRGPGPHVRGCWVVDLVLGKQ